MSEETDLSDIKEEIVTYDVTAAVHVACDVINSGDVITPGISDSNNLQKTEAEENVIEKAEEKSQISQPKKVIKWQA